MAQRPVAVGLWLCEQVIVEEGTQNVTPVNCFTRREVDHFPSEPFPFVVLADLTDGAGEVPMQAIVHRLDTFAPIYRYVFALHFHEPLETVRCFLWIRRCSFPVAGQYQVALLADGELVAHRKLKIVQKEGLQ